MENIRKEVIENIVVMINNDKLEMHQLRIINGFCKGLIRACEEKQRNEKEAVL